MESEPICIESELIYKFSYPPIASGTTEIFIRPSAMQRRMEKEEKKGRWKERNRE
jgi:hypothetical protein